MVVTAECRIDRKNYDENNGEPWQSKNNPWSAMDFDDIDAEVRGVWKTIV